MEGEWSTTIAATPSTRLRRAVEAGHQAEPNIPNVHSAPTNASQLVDIDICHLRPILMASSEAGPSRPDAEAVVRAALEAYAQLPKHGKPARRDNGVVEWTVFAAIVLSLPACTSSTSSSSPHVTSSLLVPSLGTGVKCLPAIRLPPLGDTLHDSHAEVLARRGFVRWLIDEAGCLVRGEAHSGVLEYDRADGGEGRFALCEGVEVWLYVSALPVSTSLPASSFLLLPLLPSS